MCKTKYIYSMLVILSLLLASSAVYARQGRELPKENKEFVKAVQVLTYEEISQILLEIQEYQLRNPEVSEYALNRLAISLVRQQVRKPFRRHHNEEQEGKSYVLPQRVYDLNSFEWVICAGSPLKCLKMYDCSNKAQTTAPTYFGDGCADGRCDAFRHAYWNALMVRRIDYNFARDFAAAHEGTETGLATQMDTYNNAWGQYIGQSYGSSSYTEIQVEGVVQSYVLNGTLVILKNGQIVRSNQ